MPVPFRHEYIPEMKIQHNFLTMPAELYGIISLHTGEKKES